MTPEISDKPDVYLLNRAERCVLLTNGQVVPVTHWFDDMAEECDPGEAVSCVAGSDEAGWFAIDLEQFCCATVH